MLIEFHILKNYPPTNLNRDESGAPKSCFFGGVQRGRISSQCLKRAWRTSELFGDLDSRGIRTRGMPGEVKRRLTERGVALEFAEEAEKKLTFVGSKDEKSGKRKETKESKTSRDDKKNASNTGQMIFYSEAELEKITLSVKSAIDTDGNLKSFKARNLLEIMPDDFQAGNRYITADIALFGRMVTSDFFANVDAAMSVAHAISTHPIIRESDYFTAVDDLLHETAMIGDVDYSSCCYYEYASLDTELLRKNLEQCRNRETLIDQLIPALLRVMAYVNPSGKQNSLSGQIMPELIMVECKRDKIPLSYVNAFETPVPVWGNHPDIVANSVKKLAEYVNRMDCAYELPILHRAWFAPGHAQDIPKFCEKYEKMSDLTNACAMWMREERTQ